jgi:hypothetical protein
VPLLLFIRFSGYATAEILTNFFVGFLEELEPRQIAVDISDQLYIGQGLLDSKRSLHHRYAICFLFLPFFLGLWHHISINFCKKL